MADSRWTPGLESDEKIRIPFAIDNMENSICEVCPASPERLYLVNGDGVVRNRPEMVPFRIATIEAWQRALRG